MKQRQPVTLFGMVAVALILGACGSDSGNNSSESAGDSSYSVFSSSSTQLSSSGGMSSSSLVALCTNTYGTNTVTDCRDNQTYRMVTIGTQTWMAENLNYADSAAMPNLKGTSWCAGNSADSCAKYGRLYTWTGTMNLADSFQYRTAKALISNPHQGACPNGWHVPSNDEWVTLEIEVGGSGTALKSVDGWYDNNNGTDIYGFSALPAGERTPKNGDIFQNGYDAYFWSATENGGNADLKFLSILSEYTYSDNKSKYYAYSVRCVKSSNLSSVDNSSSSSVGASSSSSIEYGTLLDSRDGQTYKTVVIGTQTWMAENLNYTVDSSWCYNDSAENCEKYGRLYQWAAAMGVDASYNDAILGDSVNHQGACPNGWHIPRNSEWSILEIMAGGANMSVAPKLKSRNGWSNGGDGIDLYGFSALPAGDCSRNNFFNIGHTATFWGATESDASNASNRRLSYNVLSSYGVYMLKGYAFSVRCLKD